MGTHLPAQSLTEFYNSHHESDEQCVTYYGLLDDAYSLEMMICGSTGAYKMTSSSEMYTLSIDQENDTLEILEWDNDEDVSGFITLVKTDNRYKGYWQHFSDGSRYDLVLSENKISNDKKLVYSKLSGVLLGKLVYIDIDHANQKVIIAERFEGGNIYKLEYSCDDSNCQRLEIIADVIKGVKNLQLLKGNSGYKLFVDHDDNTRDVEELKMVSTIYQETKAYSDYRSMLLAEYLVIGNTKADAFFLKSQSDWIKKSSKEIRAIQTADAGVIPSDRLQQQAYAWVEVELWNKDFISGIMYYQCGWKEDVIAEAFHFNIKEGKILNLNTIWEPEFLSGKEAEKTQINSRKGTLVVGREALWKVNFDRVKGVIKEKIPYINISNSIESGSWLEKLLDQNKIRI